MAGFNSFSFLSYSAHIPVKGQDKNLYLMLIIHTKHKKKKSYKKKGNQMIKAIGGGYMVRLVPV